jgi:hypothetical protein
MRGRRTQTKSGRCISAARRQARDGFFAAWATIGDWESVFTPIDL